MVTKFNPENKKVLTYKEAMEPAMEITDQADADQYLAAYVAYIEEGLKENPRDSTLRSMTPLEMAKENLGYYAGYYSNETRTRVEKLFKTKHPIFGSIATEGAVSADEAFIKGLAVFWKHSNAIAEPYPIESNVDRNTAITAMDFWQAWKEGRIKLVACKVIHHEAGLKAEVNLTFK